MTVIDEQNEGQDGDGKETQAEPENVTVIEEQNERQDENGEETQAEQTETTSQCMSVYLVLLISLSAWTMSS